MEEILIVITIKYYNTEDFEQSEYAWSFNIPNAVYIALLTGGEAAIKSYYMSNGCVGDNEQVISATMRTANIVERGQQVKTRWHSGTKTYAITPSGEISWSSYNNKNKNSRSGLLDRPLRIKPKELVKICYSFNETRRGRSTTICYDGVYALGEDGTYSYVGSTGYDD